MPKIHVVFDKKRGCGWRKGGGLYLRTDSMGAFCGKLPLELTVCPVCHAGIKPSRGFTWVDSDALFAGKKCSAFFDCQNRDGLPPCPLDKGVGMAGLLWVGEKYYPTDIDFIKESRELGISRRLARIPREFKIGKTFILLAHRKTRFSKNDLRPAIFTVFKPDRIEYVVKGTETEEKLDLLEKRGFTLVHVIRKGVIEDIFNQLPKRLEKFVVKDDDSI